METYMNTGRFPPMTAAPGQAKAKEHIDYVETEVRTKYWWEFLQIFVVVGVFALLGNIAVKTWYSFTHVLS